MIELLLEENEAWRRWWRWLFIEDKR